MLSQLNSSLYRNVVAVASKFNLDEKIFINNLARSSGHMLYQFDGVICWLPFSDY